MKTLVGILVFILLPLAARAATIHVPGDQPTIQAGIDAASSGDVVALWVAPRTAATGPTADGGWMC